MKHLNEYFETYKNASIRKLAIATNSTYTIMLKKSKQPIVGEAYDPEKVNWTAVEEYLTKKNIDWTKLDWDEINKERSHRGSQLIKDMTQFEVGMKVYLRRDNTTPYEILYKTETHIVLMKVDTTEPQSWSNSTFLLNGPVFQPRSVETKEDNN